MVDKFCVIERRLERSRVHKYHEQSDEHNYIIITTIIHLMCLSFGHTKSGAQCGGKQLNFMGIQ
jgi:hypothetical protein